MHLALLIVFIFLIVLKIMTLSGSLFKLLASQKPDLRIATLISIAPKRFIIKVY